MRKGGVWLKKKGRCVVEEEVVKPIERGEDKGMFE